VLAQAVAVAFCAIFALEARNIAEFTLRLELHREQSRLPLAPFLLLRASMALVGAIAAWQALRPPPKTRGA
jgi:hypothetical protein